MTDEEKERAKLRRIYCPPMDDATFLAIVSDYQLDTHYGMKECREVLDYISGTAEVEQSTGFDPSGSTAAIMNQEPIQDALPPRRDSSATQSAQLGRVPSPRRSITAARSAAEDSDGYAPARRVSAAHSSGAESEEYYNRGRADLSSITNSIDGLNITGGEAELEYTEHDAETDEHIAQMQKLTLEEKERVLIDMFPGLRKYDVTYTLKKLNGDFPKTMEDLLNQTFVEQMGGRIKGVDGFENGLAPPVQKKKRNKKNRSRFTDGSNYDSDASSTICDSVWEKRQEDIDLIKRLAGVEQGYAVNLYKRNGDSVPASLTEIIKEHVGLADGFEDDTFLGLSKLAAEFSEIEFNHLAVIHAISQKTQVAPEEFCEALLARPVSRRPSLADIKPAYKPASELLAQWKDVQPSKKRSINRTSDGIPKPHYSTSYAAAADNANSLYSKRNEQFSKASAAYRKARSDPLMGGAAAYYSQEARNLNSKAKSFTAAAADALVEQQSQSKMLDLHGVNVVDAVRIAREKVTEWWLRVDQAPGATHSGYKIVTGAGTHSVNGVANIRNAVGRMLIREGWKVDIGTGSIVVRGTTGVKRAYT